jgi:hypothetical protein
MVIFHSFLYVYQMVLLDYQRVSHNHAIISNLIHQLHSTGLFPPTAPHQVVLPHPLQLGDHRLRTSSEAGFPKLGVPLNHPFE